MLQMSNTTQHWAEYGAYSLPTRHCIDSTTQTLWPYLWDSRFSGVGSQIGAQPSCRKHVFPCKLSVLSLSYHRRENITPAYLGRFDCCYRLQQLHFWPAKRHLYQQNEL